MKSLLVRFCRTLTLNLEDERLTLASLKVHSRVRVSMQEDVYCVLHAALEAAASLFRILVQNCPVDGACQRESAQRDSSAATAYSVACALVCAVQIRAACRQLCAPDTLCNADSFSVLWPSLAAVLAR
jgi:hypothetical protein